MIEKSRCGPWWNFPLYPPESSPLVKDSPHPVGAQPWISQHVTAGKTQLLSLELSYEAWLHVCSARNKKANAHLTAPTFYAPLRPFRASEIFHGYELPVAGFGLRGNWPTGPSCDPMGAASRTCIRAGTGTVGVWSRMAPAIPKKLSQFTQDRVRVASG